MEITNLLDVHSREELYRWYQDNHDKAADFWLRINRAKADCEGVVRYVDAVEVALCFGWIDSTMKRIDKAFIDSTVQEKNITFPTDAKLTKKIIRRWTKWR